MLIPLPPQAQQENDTIDAKELALAIAAMASDKQGADIEILDVSGPLIIADYFVIVTARNTRHARAIARDIESQLKHSGLPRRNSAGTENDSPWVLLDFDEVVVHIFVRETRSFYDLEGLWADAPRLEFVPAGPPTTVRGAEDSLPDSIGRL